MVEVLGEGPPCEVDARGGALVGDLLDDLEAAQQVLVPAGRAGRHPEAAHAAQDGCDPVVAGGRRGGAPAELGVQMGMGIDDAGNHEATRGVDLLGGGGVVEPADLGDPPAREGHVGGERRHPGAVDQRPAPDHEVVHPLSLAHFRSRV